jgi:hypothetical protein
MAGLHISTSLHLGLALYALQALFGPQPQYAQQGPQYAQQGPQYAQQGPQYAQQGQPNMYLNVSTAANPRGHGRSEQQVSTHNPPLLAPSLWVRYMAHMLCR